jgi:hypothetical protein
MSAGFFERTRYELDNGAIVPIRVQPETLNLTIGGTANAAPAGPTTFPGSANVSRGRRANGVNARMVRVEFGTAPSGYAENSPISLPWLQPDTFNSIAVGDPGTYLGQVVVVIGKSGEQVR